MKIMESEFKLNDLFRLPKEEQKKYKLHLSAYNGYEHPLDVFARDPEEWKSWNEWRGGKDDFNREYILGMIPDYHSIITKTNRTIYAKQIVHFHTPKSSSSEPS